MSPIGGPHRRARDHAAGASQGRDDWGQGRLRRKPRRGRFRQFEVIAIGADGARIPRKGVAWSLYKIENDYQWYNTDGRWSYEPVKSSRRIADGTST